jgi:hypothetical protein
MIGCLYHIRNSQTSDVYVGSSLSIEDKLNHKQYKPIMINDHIYYSCSEAAKVLNCTPGNITYKLKSKKYSNYRYLNKSELKLKMEVSV